MILNYSWAVWLAWLLAVFFVVNGALNIAGLKAMKDAFRKWGFPAWFHILNGVIQVLIGAMIAWYPTRPLGLLLAVLLCLAIGMTLIRQRAWAHFPPAIVLLVLVLVDAWGLRLI